MGTEVNATVTGGSCVWGRHWRIYGVRNIEFVRNNDASRNDYNWFSNLRDVKHQTNLSDWAN